MLSQKNLLNYEISPLTLAIIAVENDLGDVNTHVFEDKLDYIIYNSPVNMIDYACRYFGSSLRGRVQRTKERDLENLN